MPDPGRLPRSPFRSTEADGSPIARHSVAPSQSPSVRLQGRRLMRLPGCPCAPSPSYTVARTSCRASVVLCVRRAVRTSRRVHRRPVRASPSPQLKMAIAHQDAVQSTRGLSHFRPGPRTRKTGNAFPGDTPEPGILGACPVRQFTTLAARLALCTSACIPCCSFVRLAFYPVLHMFLAPSYSSLCVP